MLNRRPLRTFILFIALVVLLVLAPTATLIARTNRPVEQAKATPKPTPALDLKGQIDKLLTSLTEQRAFMGAVLVAQGETVILSKGYGMANLELEVANTPKTKFRIGSLTKQFTAAAILQLQQAGKLKVSDSICQYVDQCPESWQVITIHHLLTHTSGIHNFTELATYPKLKYESVSLSQLIDQFRNLPLDFKPGEKWYYSNSNYILLGVIVEKAYGKGFGLFLRERILKPTGMDSTDLDNNRTLIKNRAAGYASASLNADYIHMSIPFAAGAMYATVEDLFKWQQALYGGKLLPQALVDEMTKPHVKMDVPNAELYYGYGLVIDEVFGHRRISHGGGIEGFRSELDYFPDDKVTIVVLCNREDINPFGMVEQITQMIFAGK